MYALLAQARPWASASRLSRRSPDVRTGALGVAVVPTVALHRFVGAEQSRCFPTHSGPIRDQLEATA